MSEEDADEEVAVTKRGRHVKMPAKYKAEVRSQSGTASVCDLHMPLDCLQAVMQCHVAAPSASSL